MCSHASIPFLPTTSRSPTHSVETDNRDWVRCVGHYAVAFLDQTPKFELLYGIACSVEQTPK